MPSDVEEESEFLTRRESQRDTWVGYARMVLLTGCMLLVAIFALQMFRSQTGLVYLLESVVLLGLIVWRGGNPVVRLGILLAMTVNIVSIVANASYLVSSQTPQPGASVIALLVCLCATLAVEVFSLLGSGQRDSKFKVLFWALLAFPAAIYIVGMPLLTLLWESGLSLIHI